ncbi:MAG: D-glycerate dehydrogenase [Candidatus Melainabacteria bacterium]|nr:D-glycerate dehydrogenase [Candidatus Melainabacteria bacterium]
MKKLKVLVLGQLDRALAEKLNAIAEIEYVDREERLPEEQIKSLLADKDAVISEPLDTISSAVMDSSKQLRVIANRAVGFDNVHIPDATQRGILVTNTPGVLDAATADLAMALLLATTRRICEADRYIREGKWTGFQNDLMLGPDLWGKTIGIVGMGRIGKAFAKRARAFGLKIIYTRFSPKDKIDSQLWGDYDAVRVDLDDLCKNSDFISIHCPLNSQTKGLIGQAQLDQMKPQCVLINTARGAIIDEQALVSHLVNKKIGGAGLDVFADEPNVPEELLKLDNVVLVPHIGSACFETRFQMAESAVDSILSAFSGQRPNHLVNPEVWNERTQNELAQVKSEAR